MDHKPLHKLNNITIKTNENRAQIQKGIRAIKREQLHATHRNIGLKSHNHEQRIGQENISRRRPIVSNRLSSTERFQEKFLLWKQEKGINLKKHQIKKPAFVSSVPNNRFLPSKENENCSKLSQLTKIKTNTITAKKPLAATNKSNTVLNKLPINIKTVKNDKKSKITKSENIIKDKKFEAMKKPMLKIPKKLEKINSKKPSPKKTPLTAQNDIFSFMFDGQLVTSTHRKVTTVENDTIKKPTINANGTFSLSDLSPIDQFSPEENILVDQLNTSVNQYLSPFVSTARGKGSANRENKHRDSVYQIQSEEPQLSDSARKSKAAALYFRNSLNSEIERLSNIANKWKLYKNNEMNLIDDAIDLIDVAIGQTHLLISKKFEQFRTLIDQCENQLCDKMVLPADLEAFWAMLFIQIENLNQRYDNLERLKLNLWVDADLQTETNTNQNNNAKKIRKKKKIKTDKQSFDIKAIVKKAQMNLKEKRKQEVCEDNKNEEMEVFGNIVPKDKTTKINRNTLESSKSILKTFALNKKVRSKSVAFSSPSNLMNSNEGVENNRTNFKENSLSPETPIKLITERKTNKNYVYTPMPEIKSDHSINITDSISRRRSTRTPKPRISLCDTNNKSSNQTPTSIKKRKTLKFDVTDDVQLSNTNVKKNQLTETPVSSMKREKRLRTSSRKIKPNSSYE